jgi:putative FmdB family regulatory protein
MIDFYLSTEEEDAERFIREHNIQLINKNNIMPFYAHQCPSCQNIFEKLLKIADRDTMPECPECATPSNRLVEAPMMVDPVRAGRVRPDEGFREVLHKIHSKNPGSRLNENPYF